MMAASLQPGGGGGGAQPSAPANIDPATAEM